MYTQTKRLWWLHGFQVWQHRSRRLLSNVSLHTLSTIRKCLLSENYHQSLTVFLQDVIKVNNHIKVHALNSCLFDQLCVEMDAEHKRLLLCIEIRRLSRGKSLTRGFFFAEISSRKSVTTGWVFQQHWLGLKTCSTSVVFLTCSTYVTFLTYSISHFKEKWQLFSSCQIRLLHSKPNWNYGDGAWRRDFRHVSHRSRDKKKTEVELSLFQLVHEHLL